MSGALVKAGVIVTGATTSTNFLVNGALYDLVGTPDISNNSTITITLSNLRDVPGGTCSASWSRVPFWGQGLYLDLLDPAVSSTCSTVLTNAEQLIGATARVTAYVQRNSGTGFSGATYGVRLDSVRLSTVTAGEYTRPRAPAVITVGQSSGSGSSSFNVFGQVSVPRNDLTVRWNGAAPMDSAGDAVPIGGGNMVLASLGSHVAGSGTAGVICCSPTKPAERIVNLTATISTPLGDRVVGTARIRVNDVGGPGSNLVVDEWSLS
jgi:hypothetical protein